MVKTDDVWDMAYGWLRGCWHRQNQSFTINQNLQMYMAAWLCQTMDPGLATDTWLDAILRDLNFAPQPDKALQVDAYLAAVAANTLKRRGEMAGPLLNFLGNSAREAIADTAKNKIEPPLRWMLYLRLRQLPGSDTRLPVDELDMAPEPALDPQEVAAVYNLPDAKIRAICQLIAVNTRFGQTNFKGQQENILRESLPPIALAYLRDSRLDLGCLALNTLQYLRETDLAIEYGLSFIRMQQQPSGAFGIFSVKKMLAYEERNFNLDGDVYLPITLNCLWTLTTFALGQDPLV